MANWCNARLIIYGRRGDVLSFSRLSRARPSSLFGPNMLHGEAADWRSERIVTLEPGLAKKVFIFEIRNDDGREHFCRVSRQYPALCFVLVYWEPNVPPSGSYFIRRGRVRSYELPDQLRETVMTRHGYTEDSDDDDDWRYWEASWELMDLAEAYWQPTVLRVIRC